MISSTILSTVTGPKRKTYRRKIAQGEDTQETGLSARAISDDYEFPTILILISPCVRTELIVSTVQILGQGEAGRGETKWMAECDRFEK